MAELATIARPYAEALFKATAADLSGAAVWVDQLGQIASNVPLQQYADNPNVTVEAVLEFITSAYAEAFKTSLPVMAMNFLCAVVDSGRLSALPEVASQFRVLKNAQVGTSDAVVYSAFPIDGNALAEVAGMLEKRFGRKLNVAVALQPELIGGVRVVVGDEVLDTSVKARLEQMKVALSA
jgi:F-type H+-transporting ATPase subunit delta